MPQMPHFHQQILTSRILIRKKLAAGFFSGCQQKKTHSLSARVVSSFFLCRRFALGIGATPTPRPQVFAQLRAIAAFLYHSVCSFIRKDMLLLLRHRMAASRVEACQALPKGYLGP